MRKILTAAFLLILISLTALASAGEAPSPRTITVTGSSIVTCAPDMATVNLRLISSAKTSKEAQQDNARIAKAVRAHLSAVGIDPSEIDSTQFTVSPQYGETKKQPAPIVGYTVRHTLTVTVDDLSKLSAVIDGSLEQGAAQVDSILYDCRDKDAFRAQAMTEAVLDAKKKADILAAALGEPAPKILSISETGVSHRPHTMLYKSNMMSDSAASTELSPDDIEVTASVTAVFCLP
ncbi:MAG: SIMPL domain-containing protein [Selenomonadales bacterium]|nr:SIMPL domain-containing protein [Selenomonadales bacterium]